MESDQWQTKAKEAADQGKEALNKKLQDMDLPSVEEIQAGAKELADQTAEVIKKHPLASVLGALAVGFVLGSVWGRRR